jgi:hypothetical protein
MKQTAMQEMIKKLEEKRDMWKADGKLSDRQIRGAYVTAILIAKELLEMEKQQIIDALKEGVNFEIDNSHSTQINYKKHFEQYYNETFNK